MEKTVLENEKTIIDNEVTIIENNDTTILENKISTKNTNNLAINSYFKDFKIIKQFPTTGAEADVYLIEKNNNKYILKLYRHGIELEKDKIKKILDLSKKYPEDIVQIFEIDKDKNLNRWYEIQEYAEYGTLQDIIKNNNEFAKQHIKEIIKEMTLLLQSIHKENVIHRDIKPQNILVRTLEPLDLILTDFGISSILDEELSKIMTSKSGTRIYFAPESFSGIIGYEVDFWALGMIILEIYEGSNIFKGLNEGMIAHEIFTKGVEVPEHLDEDIKLLLKGLLTRDPKKRWNEKQIFQWLEGKRDIEIHYDYDSNTNKIPYKFNNKKFYSLKSLLNYMYNLEHYEMAKSHIMRGYVTKWLEKQELFDEAVILENLKNKYEDIDIALFSIFNYFVQPKDFIWKGKVITLKNLLKYIEEDEDEFWNKNIDLLIDAYEIFIQNHEKNDDLYFVLKNIPQIEYMDDVYYFIKIVEENLISKKELINIIKNKDIDIENLYNSLKEKASKITSHKFEKEKDADLFDKLKIEIESIKKEWEKIKHDEVDFKVKQYLLNKWKRLSNQNNINHKELECFHKQFYYIINLDKKNEKKEDKRVGLWFFLSIIIFWASFHFFDLNTFLTIFIDIIISIIVGIIIVPTKNEKDYNYERLEELCKNS